jgi:MoaA/NifB/PqqE/SkfB family radical SAM enzyme
MKRVISIIKKSMDVLYVTGGEPLVRDDIEELLKHAVDVGFSYVAMNTNGSLLPKKEKVIDYLNNLVISLDSLNAEKYDPILGMKKGTAQRVIDTIKRFAPEQKKRNFTMTINCVVTPETIQDAIDVMDFCWEHEIYYTAQPQNVGESVHPKLRNNPDYQALVQRVLDGKKAGRTVSGSFVYFEQMRDLSRHQCYPTIAPHIDAQGNLWYPCRPIGAVSTNLLEVGSYEEALRRGKEIYGNPPEGCDRCRMRCYAELSTLVKNPHRMLEETTRYLASTIGRVMERRNASPATP